MLHRMLTLNIAEEEASSGHTSRKLSLGDVFSMHEKMVSEAWSFASGYACGPATAKYVFNDSGAALAKGDVIMLKAGDFPGNCTVTTGVIHPVRVYGVVLHAIADDSYGLVQTSGVCKSQGSTTHSAGALLTSDAAGEVTAAVANADATVDTMDAVIATALEAGVAATLTAIRLRNLN
jgi:hypothetical protein